MIKYISRILMLLLLGCAFSMQAADVAETRGTVTDSYGNPVAGAVVYAENGRSIGTTDVDGVFTAPVTYIDSKVKIEFLGYQTVETTLTSGMTTVLPFDNHKKNQKLNLGNISFERQDFGGAIDIATGKKLDRQPVSSMASLFPGNFTGLLSTEGSTETTLETFNYFVRGISDPHADSPLIVIDGNICYPGTESETLRYITPSEIDQITILKDAASQAIYGGQGANGVMVITTKRGTAGAPRVNAYIDASINQLSVVPDFVDSYHYATLRNQAGVNDGHGKNYYFTDDQIEGYRTQSDTRLYPNNNWRSQFLRKFVLMQRAAFDVSGGNDWVNYYVNVNTLHDGGAFHVEDNKARLGDNSYNPNTNFIWANFRSNVQAKITSWLSARVNLSGNIKREHMSQGGRVESLYSSMFVVPPTVYGPTTPYNYNEDGTLDESEYPGGQCIVTQKYQSSVYGNLNRTGEKHYTQTNINSSVSLDFDFNSITKGLTASAVIGYHSYMQRVLGTSMGYRHYMLDDNALKTGKWTFTRQGTSENDPLSWSASSQSYLDMNYRAYINYERSFGLHNVKAQAFSYLEHYENTDLPYQFINNGVDLSYNYAHRYSIRGVFSYSGSDLFSRDSRWQSLPAISLAWNANNEEFLKDYTWLSNAKLRFTVGKTGNTRSTGIGRYTYDDQMNYSTGGGALYTGDLITETYVGNPNLHAETMKKWDAGIDLGFFNMIDLTFDIYHEKMNDWIISNTVSIPEYQGAPLGIYPVTNIGKYKNKGFEIGLNIAKQYKDWEFSVGGYALRHKDLVIYCAEASRGDGYVYPYHSEGFCYGQQFGYIVDKSNGGNGYFNFQEEIDNGPKYTFGTPRVGDLKYVDLNKDGKIDSKDVAPIGTGTLPSWSYGFNGYFRYKNFDVSFMFQGVGNYKRMSAGSGFWENAYDGMYSPIHYNAWTEERWNNGDKITYPALSATSTTNHVYNSFYVLNRAYLRLKTAEISYSLPREVTKKFNCQVMKFFINGNNLLTFNHLPDGLNSDPEKDYYDLPCYRTYNIGVRATF